MIPLGKDFWKLVPGFCWNVFHAPFLIAVCVLYPLDVINIAIGAIMWLVVSPPSGSLNMGVIWGIPDTEAKFILVLTHQLNQQKIKHAPQGRYCSDINLKNLKKSSGTFRYKNVMIATQCGVCYNKLRGKWGCTVAGHRNCTRVSRNVFEEMILELDFEHLDEGKWKGSVILDRCKRGDRILKQQNLFRWVRYSHGERGSCWIIKSVANLHM